MKKITSIAVSLIIFASLFCFNVAAQVTHTVAPNESLYLISKRYSITIAELKELNNLKSDMIYAGQTLTIADVSTGKNYLQYVVVKGDTVGKIAERFGVNIASVSALNPYIDINMIYIGQKINIAADFTEYTVQRGDTLYLIAKNFGTLTEQIKLFSGITSDLLMIGQALKIPAHEGNPKPLPVAPPEVTEPTVTNTTYRVQSGDTAWNIAIQFGIPMLELLHANNLQADDRLSIGQTLVVPVHYIPVKKTPGPEYGEYLDWWTEAQYVFSIDRVATITDFYTKKTFKIKRTIGANHADCEPLTDIDTETAKSIWGGFSWNTRPVLVETAGRKIAASMSFYPHDIQYITTNNFNGHFDIHFLNSTRHSDGSIDKSHQDRVKTAAGVQ